MSVVYNMDFDWKFHRGDVDFKAGTGHDDIYAACKSGNVVGVGSKTYDDSGWRRVDLPHDYFAESSFAPENLHSHGYRERCNAWYRKGFKLDKSLKNKHLLLCFEGTAVNAEFYFNGSIMERSFSAYTETVFDITDRAYFGERVNTLAVYIKGTETEGWWYEGAGIYRHVKLYVKEDLHIAHNGIFAKPVLKKGTKNSWEIELETTLQNSAYEDAKAYVSAQLFDGDKLIASGTSKTLTCGYSANTVIKNKFSVGRVIRWDVDNPKLYTLKVNVIKNGETTDSESLRIGFRTFYIDKDKGFFLNDKRVLLKGTCNHQDHAGVGVAVPDSVQYYRVKRLKEMGTNAYRCSHNLPNKEILDACDELGLIVMDENRRFETREEVLRYLDIMVRRDRNHPSVMFYSLFNEEPLQNTDEGARIFRRMYAKVKQLDDTRIIMGAINGNAEGAGLYMDATGINYAISAIDTMRKFHPEMCLIGSENNSAVTTRGCYKSDYTDKQVLSNYDEEKVPWGQTIHETWDFVRNREWFAGIFIWTGFDYRGEPSPFKWPSVSSQFGIMDTCGFAKDSFYQNKACFTDKPMLHLLPHWNWQKGEQVRVMAVSNCDEVELFLNGKSLGRKAADVCANPEWLIDFVPGKITAKAYKNGKCVAKAENKTTGKPYAIKICPVSSSIKNDGHDTAILNFCVVDKRGRVVPTADNHLKFEVIGDGIIRGVGNGNPNSHESDVLPERDLFAGWCQALVMSKIGAKNIKVIATAKGLESAEIDLDVVSVPTPNCIFGAQNNDVSGVTMSDISWVRPDPLIKLNDDNMNSFMAVGFSEGLYQTDYHEKWRIYRARPTVAKGKYVLSLPNVYTDLIEIYIDGKKVYNCDSAIHGGEIKVNLESYSDSVKEIRILTYVEKAGGKGGGISEAIRIFRETSK